MTDDDDIDDAQAAMIDRRIGQVFAFARVAVDDPEILEVFKDGSELRIRHDDSLDNNVPNSHLPENAFIVTGSAPAGETISVAIGDCVCNATRDLASGTYWLRAGDQWVCSECRRVYSFDGEKITVTAATNAMIG